MSKNTVNNLGRILNREDTIKRLDINIIATYIYNLLLSKDASSFLVNEIFNKSDHVYKYNPYLCKTIINFILFNFDKKAFIEIFGIHLELLKKDGSRCIGLDEIDYIIKNNIDGCFTFDISKYYDLLDGKNLELNTKEIFNFNGKNTYNLYIFLCKNILEASSLILKNNINVYFTPNPSSENFLKEEIITLLVEKFYIEDGFEQNFYSKNYLHIKLENVEKTIIFEGNFYLDKDLISLLFLLNKANNSGANICFLKFIY